MRVRLAPSTRLTPRAILAADDQHRIAAVFRRDVDDRAPCAARQSPQPTILWLAITIVLGVTFLGVQIFEYGHAYRDLNLRLTSGIFGSTFFMLTGFHGFHVFVGALMLSVVLLRLIRGHFKPDQHFAFEGAAWYWHFVDVVWVGLYIVVYWL